jgi:Putative transposase
MPSHPSAAPHVLQYLARYPHRVAISNHQILNVADGSVTFQWKDYRHESQQRTMTISARGESASPGRLLHLVVNLDDTVREPSHGLQAEWHMPMSLSDERYTLADERRDHTDDEIVDGPFVKERRNDLAAAHYPDVLALSRPKALGEPADGLGDEFNTRWDRCRRWPTREDVVRSFCIECRAHLHAQVVGLSAKHLRVNRLHELAHTIKTLGGWTLREPLDVAIGPGDIAVCTRRDVDDDFACVRHDVPFQSCVGPEEMTDRVNVCIL